MRKSGILLPVFSIPSKYGIGGFGKAGYQFADQLKAARQSLWQILPLGPTGYGDSPYQSFSSFAGNPYLIDLELLQEDGLLTEEECRPAEMQGIDYEYLYQTRFLILKKAYERFSKESQSFLSFLAAENDWLDGYAQFAAIKEHFGGISLSAWPEAIRKRQEPELSELCSQLSEEILFQKFMQYLFYRQWNKLKEYANEQGIQIVGDLPIYVAYDSADTWISPELFQLDENLNPKAVAGCPPDAFSETGQLWGNPLYDWEYHKKTGYAWWIKRIRHCCRLFDTVRIDHFRGFDEYYSIPYPSKTAEIGSWEKGPGMELFLALETACPRLSIIGEDLGFLTESVLSLRDSTGFPGMKVLQFAFDAREESDYLPHNYPKNCVVYTGTHDNNTTVGWSGEASAQDIAFAKEYMGIPPADWNLCRGMIRLAMASVADTCIIPLQDYLEEGEQSRINTPSTIGNNWTYQMNPERLTPEVIAAIAHLTKLYGRCREE